MALSWTAWRLPPRLILFAAGVAGCASLLLVRGWYAEGLRFRFLAWNLILAVIPALAAAALAGADRGRKPVLVALWGLVWLLFLPNAPYLITDLVHLKPRPPVPYWFDIGLFAAFAGAGVLAAFSSFGDVQEVASRRFGRWVGWAVVAVASFAAGFGIELGRMGRWNSWDVLTQPGDLFREILARVVEPWAHPRAFAVAMLYGSVLLFGYVAIRILVAEKARGAPEA
jgi:uncharacterized membrane protein